MRRWAQITLGVAAVLMALLCSGFFVVGCLWSRGLNDRHTGLQEGVSRQLARDSPFDLPSKAEDVHYAYDLYWQGGCSICRYTYPTGDLKAQAASHLNRLPPDWIRLDRDQVATVPSHRFQFHTWFQPSAITSGWESDTSGALWQPKVWVDETHNHIYILLQN